MSVRMALPPCTWEGAKLFKHYKPLTRTTPTIATYTNPYTVATHTILLGTVLLCEQTGWAAHLPQ